MQKKLKKFLDFVKHTYKHKVATFYGRHKVLKILTIIAITFFSFVLLLTIVYRPSGGNQFKRLGSSFSIKYSEELGIDWQEAYMALLEDIDIQSLRLMSYWDDYEKENNQYDFETLDWQMEKALENDAKVSLALGLRQPRWPECHQPNWASNLQHEEWKSELNEYIAVVVNRYKTHPALESYQLENEAFNQWFGICDIQDRKVLRERLVEEFNLVKSLDSEHPVIMSLSDQHGFPFGQPTPDIYGYSIYRVVYNTQIIPFYLIYPTPVWYHRMRAAVVDVVKDRPILVHELQLEPWGPKPTVELDTKEQDRSMSPAQMYRNVDFARQIGLDEGYLWGAEWWYWRKTVGNDPIIWETAKDIVNQVNTGQDFQKKIR